MREPKNVNLNNILKIDLYALRGLGPPELDFEKSQKVFVSIYFSF